MMKQLDASKRVNIRNVEEAAYHIKLNIGTPDSQNATLVLDTGSEYLAVTSSLCDSDPVNQNVLAQSSFSYLETKI